MAWTDLKAAIAAVIRTNGNQEITGALLQSTLKSIIDQVGANASYKGVAVPSTNPGTPDGIVFYLASTSGVYANFSGITLLEGEICFLRWSGSAWVKDITKASKGSNYPFLDSANGSYPLTIEVLKSFIKDGYLEGPFDSSKLYAFTEIKRNTSGWQIRVYSQTGSPGTFLVISEFYTTTNPENGDNVTVHDLSEKNNSGFKGKISVNWSRIPVGSYNGMWSYLGFGIDPKFFTVNIPGQKAIVFGPDELKMSKNTQTLLHDNTRLNEISYLHPRGLTEYEGDSTYTPIGSAVTQYPLGRKTLVRKISAPIYVSSSFTGFVEIRKSTTFSPDPSSHTLVESFSYGAGQMNSDSNIMSSVILSEDLVLEANEYLYFYVIPSTGSTIIKRWTTQATNPVRIPIFFRLSGVWYEANQSNLSCSLILQSTDYTISELKEYIDQQQSILDNAIVKDSNTLLIENTKIKEISYLHPRGLAEYEGDATYASQGVALTQYPLGRKTLVRRIKCRMYVSGNFSGSMEVRKSTTFGPNPDSHTLVESIPYGVGEFNMDSNSFGDIILSQDLILEANEYLFVYAIRVTGQATLKRWTTLSSSPSRIPICFKLSGTWYEGSTGYYSTSLLLYNDSYTFSELLQKIETQQSEIDSKIDEYSPRLTIPNIVHAVVGSQLNLWYDALILSPDRGFYSPSYFAVEGICNVGQMQERSFRITPVIGDVGDHTLTINVYNPEKKLVQTKSVILRIINNTAPSSVKNIIMLGDSLTAAGTTTITLQGLLASLGGSTPLFWGTKGIDPAKHEGYGGWAFASFLATTSPFYIGGRIDIPAYRASKGLASPFDVVIIALGVNDTFGGTEKTQTEINTIINYAKDLIDHFLNDGANTQIIINLPTTDCNTKGGYSVNYGALCGKELYQKSMFLLRENILSTFDGGLYSPRVHVGISGLGVDRYFGYPFGTGPASSRSSEVIFNHINAVHPNTSGYQQIADVEFPQVLKLIQ